MDHLEAIGGVAAYSSHPFCNPCTSPYFAAPRQCTLSSAQVASMEITDHTLLRRIGATGRPVIVSSGMASAQEVAEALHTLRLSGAGPLALLKCTSAYPATAAQAHLATLPDMRERFPGVTLGLSDHTLGHVVPTAAGAPLTYLLTYLLISRRPRWCASPLP